MRLVTYATHDSGYFQALRQSADANGFDLTVLGFDTEWKGFTNRISAIVSFLKEDVLLLDELVCCVDGFDCIVVGGPGEVEQKYTALVPNRDRVLFSTSVDHWVVTKLFGPIHPDDENKKYNRLNAGMYIGTARTILRLFESLCRETECDPNSNDQKILSQYYLQTKNTLDDLIQLDYTNTLFYNTEVNFPDTILYMSLLLGTDALQKIPLKTPYYRVRGNRFLMKNGEKPVFIQAAGDVNMDNITQHFGLPDKKQENRNYFLYSTFGHLKQYLKQYLEQTHYAKQISLTIQLLHIIVTLVTIYITLFSKNITLLCWMIFYEIVVVLQWFYIGSCVSTIIENVLVGSSKQTSVNTKFLERALGKNTVYHFFTLLPVILTGIALYRINKLCRFTP